MIDQALAERPGAHRSGGRSVRTADAAKGDLDQAEKLAKALAKGTPNRKEIALTIASDKVREMV